MTKLAWKSLGETNRITTTITWKYRRSFSKRGKMIWMPIRRAFTIETVQSTVTLQTQSRSRLQSRTWLTHSELTSLLTDSLSCRTSVTMIATISCSKTLAKFSWRAFKRTRRPLSSTRGRETKRSDKKKVSTNSAIQKQLPLTARVSRTSQSRLQTFLFWVQSWQKTSLTPQVSLLLHRSALQLNGKPSNKKTSLTK